MNKERQNILRKLMHDPGITFNKLWNKEGTSNSFAYHIKILEEDGLIEKKEEKHFLEQGIKAMSFNASVKADSIKFYEKLGCKRTDLVDYEKKLK